MTAQATQAAHATGLAPTVFVSAPHGAAAGNILRTGLVRRLLDARESIEVVLLSPLVRDPAFVREFEQPRLHFENLPSHRPEGLEARLLAFVQAGYLDSGVTESVRIRRAEAVAARTIRWIRAKRLLARVLAPSMIRKETRYRLVDRLISHPGTERLFERYRPVLLVASSPGLIFAEMPLLRTAARRNVRSMAVDPSWDNFTNKLLPVRRVDRLIVWNEVMKREAIELHGYRSDEVQVAGSPQWDRYFHAGPVTPRDAFLRKIGGDPARRLITLTTTPPELYAHHDHVLRVIIGALSSGRLSVPAQVLVRLHPRDELQRYTQFRGVPHVIVEKPFRPTIRTADGLAVDVTADNQQHLADTLRHSDVIVNVASTIAIEAAIFDTPVVNVAFDGETASPWVRSARRYYRFTHYTNIARHGAVRIAERPDQLIDHINAYLETPSLDADGRRRVVLEQCGFVDGRSADRVAAAVIAELSDVLGSSMQARTDGSASRTETVPA